MQNTRLRYSSDPKWSNEAVPLVLPQNRVPSPCSRLVIDSNCSTVWCNHRQPPITAKHWVYVYRATSCLSLNWFDRHISTKQKNKLQFEKSNPTKKNPNMTIWFKVYMQKHSSSCHAPMAPWCSKARLCSTSSTNKHRILKGNFLSRDKTPRSIHLMLITGCK